MWEDIDIDRHFLGKFNIDGEELQGEIMYNKESGVIWLKIQREVSTQPGKSYGFTRLITGKLHSGALVSLYHNTCIKNHTQFFAYQEIVFRVDYMIFGKTQDTYNQLICVLENGLQWSGLSQIDTSDFQNISFKGFEELECHWYNVKISFFTTIENELLVFRVTK